MMLDHLGHPEAAADMIVAIENLLKGDGPKTPDMGAIQPLKICVGR